MSIATADTTAVMRSDELDDYPRPPSLHWARALAFYVLTGGLIAFVWIYRQAAWVRRIDPSSKALWILATAFACSTALTMTPLIVAAGEPWLTFATPLVNLGVSVSWIWAYLSMRQSIEARFELKLSGILTFFFHGFYLQYHMNRIAKGEHSPHREGLCLSARFS